MKHKRNLVPIRTRPRICRRSLICATTVTITTLLFFTLAWISIVFSLEPNSHHHTYPVSSSHSDAGFNPGLKSRSEFNPGSELDLGSDLELSLKHIIFGIAGSSKFWTRRKEIVRLWWRNAEMRGHVWLEEHVDRYPDDEYTLPDTMVSEDISRFRYTNPTGHPSGLRISRIVSECFRLGLPGVRWFVMGDDDTVFDVENLVLVLGKYNASEMVYVGGPSESHSANTYFSHSMAFGGGGIAISHPLAEALSKIQVGCLERYPKLYGSDDRLHACITELGIPLSKEYGFHQWDIRGNVHGLLASHPVAPFISVHHVEAVDPFYPGLTTLESLKLFTKAMRVDPKSILQRSICYDHSRRLTFAISLGYVVQVFPNIVLPRELERSEQTYVAWNGISNRDEFDFDTRDSYQSVCRKPVLFFLKDIVREGNYTLGTYYRTVGKDDLKRKVFCFPRSPPLPYVQRIRVIGHPFSKNWHLAPRRLCCNLNYTGDKRVDLTVGQCENGYLSSATPNIVKVF